MMADELAQGEGWAAATGPEALGESYGFRKVRQELGVTEFGVNLITMPPGYNEGRRHYHERQQELYFVHRGTLAIEFGDGGRQEIRAGGAVRVDATTVRSVSNPSQTEDVQYLAIGAEGGYVGRDGRQPRED
jgi:uncharacterized cupin superfamily protein